LASKPHTRLSLQDVHQAAKTKADLLLHLDAKVYREAVCSPEWANVCKLTPVTWVINWRNISANFLPLLSDQSSRGHDRLMILDTRMRLDVWRQLYPLSWVGQLAPSGQKWAGKKRARLKRLIRCRVFGLILNFFLSLSGGKEAWNWRKLETNLLLVGVSC